MKTILIVDDQAGIRILLNEVFQREGFQTILAANGLEAIKLFSEQHVDGVVGTLEEVNQTIEHMEKNTGYIATTAEHQSNMMHTLTDVTSELRELTDRVTLQLGRLNV